MRAPEIELKLPLQLTFSKMLADDIEPRVQAAYERRAATMEAAVQATRGTAVGTAPAVKKGALVAVPVCIPKTIKFAAMVPT